MDADGEHPPQLIPTMLEKWRQGARVVQAVRTSCRRLPLAKRLTSRLFYRIFAWMAQTPIPDGAADFRLLDRTVIDVLAAHPNAAGFLRGFIPWAGFETVYIPYRQGLRTAGRSRFSLRKMADLARRGIIGFSVKPLRVSMMLGLLTCLFALANLVYVLVVRLFFPENVVPGWATLAGLLALLGGVQLLVIGILGEYIGILFEIIRNPPPFIIAEDIGFFSPPGAPEDPAGPSRSGSPS